jgi:hypothetical protein
VVKEFAGQAAALGQLQIVATFFIGNAQIRTGAPPFRTMVSHPSVAMERQKMGQLMAQGAINFIRPDPAEGGVEMNGFLPVLGHSGGGAQTGIPHHIEWRQFRVSTLPQQLLHPGFQTCIPQESSHFFGTIFTCRSSR